MEEGIIRETSESISLGMGIRVITGDKTGYGYTNDFSKERMIKTALSAANIASGGRTRRTADFRTRKPAINCYHVIRPAETVPLKEKTDLVKRAYAAAENFDLKIKKVRVSLADSTRSVTVLNSEGLRISDTRPMIRLVCLAVAEKPPSREAGFSGGGGRVGMEYFEHTLSPEDIGRDAAQEAVHLLAAKPPPAGEMPVILSAGHSGVLIHEAVGHLLEADFIRKKTSVFWNKKGRQVAKSGVNIIDDPTIPNFRGSYNIDDEGTIPEKTVLVQKGKLVGFLQDRLSASLMHLPLTGHGRRQSYMHIPIPRMSNTYIDRGEYDREEILKSVKHGFYAQRFQGGQVEDSGKFTFTVSSGFLIEDGRMTTPVKQATLIGSNLDILNKIEKIGSDLTFGLQTGTCGKGGQEAPVMDGCPTLKITSMTVGGMK